MSAFMQILTLLIVVCGLLLLWGCTARSFHAPLIETTSAPLLATFQLPQSFIETLPARLTPAPTFALTSLATSRQPAIFLPVPTCYSQPQRVIVCLGQVMNQGRQTVRDVRLSLRLGSQTRTVSPEQRLIMAGDSAPYRVQFDTTSGDVQTQLDHFTLTSEQPLAVTLTDEQGSYHAASNGYGVYEYRARLIVGEQALTRPWRLIVTLFDEQQRVVGYRVVDSDQPLPAHSNQSLQIEIIPQIIAEYYTAQAGVFSR